VNLLEVNQSAHLRCGRRPVHAPAEGYDAMTGGNVVNRNDAMTGGCTDGAGLGHAASLEAPGQEETQVKSPEINLGGSCLCSKWTGQVRSREGRRPRSR
jgi:hypothetical protein